MAQNLQVDQSLSATAQPVKDENGNTSPLTVSTDGVGIGTTTPDAPLTLQSNTGDVLSTKDQVGTTRFTLHSHHAVPFFHELKANNYDLRLSSFVAGGSGGSIEFHTGTDISTEKVRIDKNGKVGIGTTNPRNSLGVRASGRSEELVSFEDPKGNTKWHINQNLGGDRPGLNFVETGVKDARLFIQPGGNVGIGTFRPTEALEVQGNIFATGDVKLTGADCAEDFDVEELEALEPGMVMVIGEEERLHRCSQAYDRRVAGVLSGAGENRPGIVLGKQVSQKERLPLALTGKVYCKVDATFAPVGIGDLLTTSPTPGYAMKASDHDRSFGAVLGKALRPLAEGIGLVPILVSLQ